MTKKQQFSTTLQRRLTLSPEAIYQSLRCRWERLKDLLRDLGLLQRGGQALRDISGTIGVINQDERHDLEHITVKIQAGWSRSLIIWIYFSTKKNANRFYSRLGIHALVKSDAHS